MGIAVDGTSVYWNNNNTMTVMKVPLAGGTPIKLADNGPFWPRSIAVDATSVYFTDGAGGIGTVTRLTPK